MGSDYSAIDNSLQQITKHIGQQLKSQLLKRDTEIQKWKQRWEEVYIQLMDTKEELSNCKSTHEVFVRQLKNIHEFPETSQDEKLLLDHIRKETEMSKNEKQELNELRHFMQKIGHQIINKSGSTTTECPSDDNPEGIRDSMVVQSTKKKKIAGENSRTNRRKVLESNRKRASSMAKKMGKIMQNANTAVNSVANIMTPTHQPWYRDVIGSPGYLKEFGYYFCCGRVISRRSRLAQHQNSTGCHKFRNIRVRRELIGTFSPEQRNSTRFEG